MRRDYPGTMKWLAGALSLIVAMEVVRLSAAQQSREPGPVARLVQTRANGGAIVASVSPDGRFLVFADWTAPGSAGDIAIQDLSTGEYRQLTNLGGYNAGFSAISPDGRQVAYSWRNTDRVSDLRLIGVDGSNPRVLQADKDLNIHPSDWSPDGSQILARLARKDGSKQIALISAADGSMRILKALDSHSPERLRFSPDGRFIVYDLPERSDVPVRDIFLLRIDTMQQVPLVAGATDDVVLGWTLDGKQVLFARRRAHTMDAWALPVGEGRPRRQPRLVRRDLGDIDPLGFSRDGAFYFARGKGGRHVYLVTVNPATGSPVRPPSRASVRSEDPTFGPTWSPDGDRLAYFSTRSGSDAGILARTIVIRSTKMGNERVLSPPLDYPGGGFHPRELRWSPDGRSLLTISNDRQGLWSFYVVNVQTSAATILVRGRPGEILRWPAWSPDGKVLFYVHEDPSTQLSRNLARDMRSGRVKELYQGRIETMVLSPDGQYLAFSQPQGLMLQSSNGGEPRELLKASVQLLTWTPDGRVLFTGRPGDSAEAGLWSVAPDDSKPHFILGSSNMQGYQLQGRWFEASVHPNGRDLAFTTGPITYGEVWKIENFLPALKSGR